VGTVTQLWRYPVKSMQGTPVEAVTVGPGGVDGDRAWGVVDLAAGKVLSAKRWPTLLLASAAAADDGTVTITLPDGATHTAGDPATDAAVSAWLDREVRVQQPPTGEGLPFDVVPAEAPDDTSDVGEWAGPPGGPFVDLAAVHLITTASLGTRPVRRFRPNIVADVGGEGFVEDSWLDGSVRVGEVVVTPFMRTPRCAMVTRAQPGLDPDPGIARELRQQHGLDLGVYCGVERPGVIHVGDPVHVGT
jgi:uncharacterized protein